MQSLSDLPEDAQLRRILGDVEPQPLASRPPPQPFSYHLDFRWNPSPEQLWLRGHQRHCGELEAPPRMGEMEDLVQLRLLNLELLRQLWAGQKAVRRSVAKATSGTLQARKELLSPRGGGQGHLVQPTHFTVDAKLRPWEGRDWARTLLKPQQALAPSIGGVGGHWLGRPWGDLTCPLQSSLYSSSSYDSETPVSPETSSAFSGASCSQDKRHVGDSLDTPRGIPHDRISSRVASLPPAKCQHPESLESSRPRSAPLPPTTEPVPSAGLGHLRPPETQAPRSMLAGQSKPSKVTWESWPSTNGFPA